MLYLKIMDSSFIDDPSISNIIFYPRKAPKPNNLRPHIKPLTFAINENIKIGGYFYLNEETCPTILFFHGNGEIALEYQYFYNEFFKIGVNLAVMDFRGYGHSSGHPTYTSLLTDPMPIYYHFIKWLEENKVTGSLFVQGRSLGSTCAAEIGFHDPKELKGLIFESSFASAYNMMTRLFRINSPKITPESLKDYSNDTRMRKIQKPVLILHGSGDWIIPNSEAKLIYDALPGNIDKKLILIEGAGHNDILSHEKEYFTPLKEFILKYS